MSFDIRQLRYAIPAADHGSFYRAARALDIEQSTLSRTSDWSARSGCRSLSVPRAGVNMTLAGSVFLRSAKPMVETADKMVSMMRAAGQGHAGGLRPGLNSSVQSVIPAKIYRAIA
jgi:DNA-binding transcriptional LysR family regulator